MSTKDQLSKLGVPAFQGQNRLFFNVGTAAITLSILILLTWVSVAFGNSFHFSFAWILTIFLAISYFRQHVKLSIATTVVLIVGTLVALLIGYPSPSAFSLIIFIVLLVAGWILQFFAFQRHSKGASINQQLLAIFYAPMSYTYFILELCRINSSFDDAKPQETEHHDPHQ